MHVRVLSVSCSSLLLLLALPAARPVSAHEVTIHHRLSLGAVERAQGLRQFIRDFEIDDLPGFNDDSIQGASLPLAIAAVMPADQFREFGSEVTCWRFTPGELIRAGSITEDAGKRFCNHFYFPTSLSSGAALDIGGIDAEELVLCDSTQDAASWALNGNGNAFSWTAAMDDYYLGFVLDDSRERERAWTRMFYALGHVIHLAQDLSQPSHTRNDSHACRYVPAGALSCSAFERYFHDVRNRGQASQIVAATGGSAERYDDPREYFSAMANFSAAQFFSDDTVEIIEQFDVIGLPGYPPPLTPDFSHVYSNLGALRRDPYMRNGLLPAGQQEIASATIVTGGGPPLVVWTLDNSTVMMNYARQLYPPAVLASAGLLDHFFRARLAAEIIEIRPESASSTARVKLRLTNRSNLPGAGAASMTLRELGKLEFYADVDGERRRLQVLSGGGSSLAPGGAATFTVQCAIPASGFIASELEITAVYRGAIGATEGVVGAIARQPANPGLCVVSLDDSDASAFGGVDQLSAYGPDFSVRTLHARPYQATGGDEQTCGCPNATDPVIEYVATTSSSLEVDVQPAESRLRARIDRTRSRQQRRQPTEDEAQQLARNPQCCTAVGEGSKDADFVLQYKVEVKKGQVFTFDCSWSAAVVTADAERTGWRAVTTFMPLYALLDGEFPTLCAGSFEPQSPCNLPVNGSNAHVEFSYDELRQRREAALASYLGNFNFDIPTPPGGIPGGTPGGVPGGIPGGFPAGGLPPGLPSDLGQLMTILEGLTGLVTGQCEEVTLSEEQEPTEYMLMQIAISAGAALPASEENETSESLDLEFRWKLSLSEPANEGR